MNLVADAHIQTVKRTTPQYLRSQSLKSSSASNEYFSDYASDALSQKSDITKASYETPPSRISSPIPINPVESEMTLPSRPGAVQPAPLNIRHARNNGKPTVRMLSSFDEMSPPTPGIDDTPYIRFAIDQLTRDEDVMGQGHHSTASPLHIPVTPTFNPPASDSDGFSETPTPSPPPQTPPEMPPSPRPMSPIQPKPVQQEILMPVDLSKDLRRRLGFVPLPLRPSILGLYLLLCLLMIAALIFSLIFGPSSHGLFDYDGNTTPRYFVFKYLPQLIGLILILWLFVIEAAIYRALPYFCMGSGRRDHWVLQSMSILPANHLLPDFNFFRNGEVLLGATFVIFWVVNFSIPLLSSVFQTQWITNDGTPRFRWTAVRGVGWTLVGLYALHCVAIIYCAFRFRSRNSNLLWDPCSLADLICLFRRSNVGSDFEQTEISPDPNGQIPPRNLRLGFFTTSQRADVFHGVGEEYAPLKRLSLQPAKPLETILRPNNQPDLEAQQRLSYGSAFSRNVHSPFVRYRWAPWFLRDSAVLAWIIAAVLLVIAFLVVSFVNRAVERGFDPLLPSLTDSRGFSPANFLYSFLPALLGMIGFLAWQPIDMYFRAVQPFCNLSRHTGATAGRSLLLSYPAHGHIHVVVRSILNRDYKVTYITFVSLLSASIPVLAGGVFSAQFFSNDDRVRMVASMPGYIALCVLVTLYALSYLTVWPTRKRYLPHSINTIAGLMSWLYASPLLGEVALQNVGTKAELVDILTGPMSAPTAFTGDTLLEEKGRPSRRAVRRRHQDEGMRYAFGLFVGRDGKEHLGIDRLQRPGSRNMLFVPT